MLSKSMLVSRKRDPPHLQLSVNDMAVEQVKHVKYLGVCISEDLSWSRHIAGVCLKAKRVLGFTYRSFGQADNRLPSKLYKALVLPILEYCTVDASGILTRLTTSPS